MRAAKTSLLVGSALVVINQGPRLLHGDVDMLLLAQLLLTFVVPYVVSTAASVGVMRDMQEAANSDGR